MAFLHLHGSGRPASPDAGRLPDDPYYKLRRQTDLRAKAQPAASSTDKVSLYFDLSQAHGALDEVTNAIDAVVPRAKRREITRTNKRVAELRGDSSARVVAAPRLVSEPIAQPLTEVPPVVDRTVLVQQEEAESWLRENCPAASEEMTLASERIVEAGDAVGLRQTGLLAQCLESLRRAIRMLADYLVDPGSKQEFDRFGKKCRTDFGGYVSRLHLALESFKAEDGLFEYDKSELDLFHRRMTRLNDRLGSGVHGTADYEEARQLYADVWRIVAIYRRVIPRQLGNRLGIAG